MSSLFAALFALLASSFRTRASLQAEILALRHQLAVFQKNAPRRLRLHRCDRLLWVVLYRFWSGWRRCLEMVQPDTVLRWHRRAFAWHWTRKSCRLPGRPEVAANIRDLIRRMSQANPCGVHPAFTENCSSWGLRWRNPRWPDICLGPANRLPRLVSSIGPSIFGLRDQRCSVDMRQAAPWRGRSPA